MSRETIHPNENMQSSHEAFFKLLYVTSNPIVLTRIDNGHFIEVNDAFCRLTGCTRDELLKQTTIDLGIWPSLQDRGRMLRELHDKGSIRNLELTVPTKDGQVRTLLVSVDIVALNGYFYLLATGIDVSERKRDEQKLRESEAKYRMLVENSLQGLAIVQDFRFVFCNRRFAEITGYSIGELLSLSSDQVRALIHPDDREVLVKFYGEQTSGGQVPESYQFRGLKKDGSEIWLEVFSSLIFYDGKPAVQAVFQDITGYKKALQAIEESQQYLNRVINCIGDPIFVKDQQYRHVFVNDALCAWTGKRREEFIGRTVKELFPGSHSEALEKCDKLVFETGKENVTEDEIEDDQGHVRTVMTKKTLLVDHEGNRQIVGIIRDITELKRLEAQLRQAQKMEAVGVLAGGVAHDFNNLLTVILGMSELVLCRLPKMHPLRESIEEISKAGQQAASLTSRLLAFSRKQIISPKILNLNEVVEETGSMLRRIIGEDIELVVQAQPGLGMVNADPAQIQQILMNLAANSRDAMPQGGRFTLETADVYLDDDYVKNHPGSRTGHYVMLAVGDNGIGMDKATQARIFEPFFTTKERGRGTGLGLPSVYGIVKQSNGYIEVHSELGTGTVFRIYLPCVQAEASEQATSEAPVHEIAGDKTILLVEDEAQVRNLTGRILRTLGCRVLEAPDGSEALRIAQEYEGGIDLVITDVVMPKMSGKALVTMLESIRPGIKSLYVSGYTDDEIVNHGILDSRVAFLQKPFTLDSLTSKVAGLIQSA